MIPKENVVVVISNEGYIKRVSMRSYSSANGEETGLKENDYVTHLFNITTTDVILLFTNMGNYLYVPVYDIFDGKWKDLGKHISNIIPLSDGEKIINAIGVYDFDSDKYITTFTKNGMVKRTKLIDYKVLRYNKPIKAINLKDDDMVVDVTISDLSNVFISTSLGYGLWYDTSEIPILGVKAAGVKAINLKDDFVVSGTLFDAKEEFITILTDKGTGKRTKLLEFEKTSRAKRGILLMKVIKSNPSKIIKTYITNSKDMIGVVSDNYTKILKLTEIPIMDRYSNGSYVIKDRIIDSYKVCNMISKDDMEKQEEDIKFEKKDVSLKEIDDMLSSVDEVLDDTK